MTMNKMMEESPSMFEHGHGPDLLSSDETEVPFFESYGSQVIDTSKQRKPSNLSVHEI